MAQRSDDGIFKFISGLFLGLLGGFAAGVLLADKPGRELRRDIELNSEEMMHNLKDRFADLKDEASIKFKDFSNFTDEKFKRSALNIQDKVAELGKQLDDLTLTQTHNGDNN